MTFLVYGEGDEVKHLKFILLICTMIIISTLASCGSAGPQDVESSESKGGMVAEESIDELVFGAMESDTVSEETMEIAVEPTVFWLY